MPTQHPPMHRTAPTLHSPSAQHRISKLQMSMEKPPWEKGESQELQRLIHYPKSQPLNKQKEELICSLLIQTLLKGQWLPGILNKTPNRAATIFIDHNFWLCGEIA